MEYGMRAVVFDLDGTLIDSDPDIRAALNRVLMAEGLAPLTTAEPKSMIGDGAKALVERGFAARGQAAHPDHVAASSPITRSTPWSKPRRTLALWKRLRR